MKITILCCLSSVILIVISLSVLAQSDFRPGYLITLGGDTIYGFVDYRGDLRNSKTCTFKKDIKDNATDYNPEEIKAYRFFESKYYISKAVEVESEKADFFVEYLVDGIIDLYYMAYKNTGFYLLEREDGTMYKLKSELKNFSENNHQVYKYQEYIGILKNAFQKSPELFNEIDKVKLSHESLGLITSKYHDLVCDDQQCVVYTKEIAKVVFNLKLIAGINVGSIYFSSGIFFSDHYERSFYPTIGLNTDIRLPQINEKLSLFLNADIGKNAFFSVEEINKYSRSIRTLEISVLPLTFHAGLKYTYPKGRYRPFYSLGAGFYVPINPKTTQRFEYIESSKIWTSLDEYEDILKPLPGVAGSVGVNLVNKTRQIFSVRVEYKYNSKTYRETAVKSNIFSLIAGYYFNYEKSKTHFN